MIWRLSTVLFLLPLLAGAASAPRVMPQDVLPALPSGARIDARPDPADGTQTIYIARDRQEKIVAYAVPGRSRNGYAGLIELLVGLSPDRRVIRYRTTLCKETKGFGAHIADAAFINRFSKKPADETLRIKKDGGPIAAVTGATISSRAVCEAIVDARRRLDRLEGLERAEADSSLRILEPDMAFDPTQDETLKKVLPAATTFKRLPARSGERFAPVQGFTSNGKSAGYALVGTGRAAGPQGELVIHILFGFRDNRLPTRTQLILNPPSRLADMETAQRVAYTQAFTAAMETARILP